MLTCQEPDKAAQATGAPNRGAPGGVGSWLVTIAVVVIAAALMLVPFANTS